MRKLILFLSVIGFIGLGSSQAILYSVGLDKDQYTTDFMIGDVVVAIIFPESDGSLDLNKEDWTAERKAQVISEIIAGHQWWAQQNPNANLKFTYVTETIATKYEPIARPYYAEALWIPDVLGKLGFSGNRFTATQDYVNALREEHETDWGFVIFVVDSLNDYNGKLADGYFAYAYLGGPFMVMTYDNNGYGIENMDVVAAHEMGHVFHALDQYAGASSPSETSGGYFVVPNGNHAYSSIANDPKSIMRGGIRWGLDHWTKKMVGWTDEDDNNLSDIVDQSSNVGLSPDPSSNSNASTPDFTGSAAIRILPRQANTEGKGFTVDTIASVEYKTGTNDWIKAIPTDGSFDSAVEAFEVYVDGSFGSQAIQAQDVEIRVVTAYELLSGSDGDFNFTAVATSLGNAHAFPNPFKPHSSLGHINVTFTGLTAGAKVQVFTAAGETVFEQSADNSTGSLQWAAKNDSGDLVSSGVYFYLISDVSGNLKKGKLAVIR